MEMTAGQRLDLLAEIRILFPDADYSAAESFGGEAITFWDSCSCYSEYTTECCRLEIFVAGTLPADSDARWVLKDALDLRIESWAKRNLIYSGCEYCGEDTIAVNVRIFDQKSGTK